MSAVRKDIVRLGGELSKAGFGDEREREGIRALGRRIEAMLRPQRLGNCDGVEFGDGTFEIVLVGPDAERITTSIRPLVQGVRVVRIKTITKVFAGGESEVVDVHGNVNKRSHSRNKNKQDWTIGDLFAIPLSDGTSGYGQVVAEEPAVLRSVSIAVFGLRTPANFELPELALDAVIACLFVTSDLLSNGTWGVVGNQPPVVPQDSLPYEATRSSGWIGAKVIGSRNITSFLEAFHLLRPWNDFADPQYSDKLLLSVSKRPTNVILR